MDIYLADDIGTLAQRAKADELVRLIRKLRWIGMDRDAEALQDLLETPEAADCVLAAPLDTD